MGRGCGAGVPIQRFFLNLHLGRTPLTWPPSQKQTPPSPPLKHEVPLHEMVPRKSTINNNLKSS